MKKPDKFTVFWQIVFGCVLTGVITIGVWGLQITITGAWNELKEINSALLVIPSHEGRIVANAKDCQDYRENKPTFVTWDKLTDRHRNHGSSDAATNALDSLTRSGMFGEVIKQN